MSDLPIHFWTEPVDDKVIACHARVRVTHHGGIWGASAFALVDRDKAWAYVKDSRGVSGYAQYVAAREALYNMVREKHDGHFPFMCRVENRDQLGVV